MIGDNNGVGSGGLGKSVCVIGAGALGLVAIKNLVEEGFDVTCFERNDYIGGLWHSTLDGSQTSTLAGTISNISKQGMAFSDFPLPDHYPLHPTAKQMQEYLESYAAHFDISQYINLSTSVINITRDEEKQQWNIVTTPTGKTRQERRSHVFDRLILATGALSKARQPTINHLSEFRGQILHSQGFKDPSTFAGKTVLVVGVGATGADSLSYLSKAGAKKLYVSHRHEFVVVPRVFNGKALDHNLSLRLLKVSGFIRKTFPAFAARMMLKNVRKWQDEAFPGLKEHKRIRRPSNPVNPMGFIPVVSDDLADNLLTGRVESIQAISYVSGPSQVTLIDGTVVDDIDALLFCTGLGPNFDMLLPSQYDPANPDITPHRFAALPRACVEERRYLHLYRGVISLQEPHSLAFIGYNIYMRGIFGLYDLVTMALAQIWKGNFPLPEQQALEAEASRFYENLAHSLNAGASLSHPGLHLDIEHDIFFNKAAGTGVYEHIGSFLNWQSWKMWWRDPHFYRMLLDGILSPHTLRLFETGAGRKAWPGARSAIEQANREAKRLGLIESRRKLI